MLEVQKYLRNGKTLADLESELGIKATIHDTLPLVIVNYSQIDSPKTHPVVRECRGLVLRSDNFDLVARSFPRFFNWGEVADEMPLFNFRDFASYEKVDGSLVVIYHHDGQWHANTRGSFGLDNMQNMTISWREGFCQAMGVRSLDELDLRKEITYVCEFCSPYNKIVRRYEKPTMYLLTAFAGENELPWEALDGLAAWSAKSSRLLFQRPHRYEHRSIEDIQEFLKVQAEQDPTFEGVVICDRDGRRWKIKSPTYLGLHKLRGEGDNVFAAKNLLPFVLAGEASELLTYFPEVTDAFNSVNERVTKFYEELVELWEKTWRIPVQKDFALAILGRTPFTGLLFTLRKVHGQEQTKEKLKTLWRDSPDIIVKHL
jgi:hypothetical protein